MYLTIDDWRLNIFRGVKENRLKLEANKIARRKCWETGEKLEECAVSNYILLNMVKLERQHIFSYVELQTLVQ